MNQAHTLDQAKLCDIITKHYPATQAIYLFGSHANGEAWPSSDLDLAILLPHAESRRECWPAMSECATELAMMVHTEVDLVNLRAVGTILQKEIIHHSQRIFATDAMAADLFEIQVVKNYQKLKEERADILAEGLNSGRFYQP